MPTISGVIYLTSENAESTFKVIARLDCPVGSIYFLPTGSTTWDLSTGRTTELLPGVYVNPKTLGVIKNVK